jgi:hypothetical protein
MIYVLVSDPLPEISADGEVARLAKQLNKNLRTRARRLEVAALLLRCPCNHSLAPGTIILRPLPNGDYKSEHDLCCDAYVAVLEAKAAL